MAQGREARGDYQLHCVGGVYRGRKPPNHLWLFPRIVAVRLLIPLSLQYEFAQR